MKVDGADTISFAVTGTIILASRLPAITGTLTIQGPGVGSLTVSGGSAVRILQVSTGASLILQGLTPANGRAPGGGTVHNEGTLSVSQSVFRANRAPSSDTDGTAGGAIFSTGSLTIRTSTFGGNRSSTRTLLIEAPAGSNLRNVAFADSAPSCARDGT